jgi:hypothetical protein
MREWRATEFGPLIDDLATTSGLTDQVFLTFWQSVVFQTGGTSDHIENLNTEYSQKRLADLAALLPRLVADRANQDRWSARWKEIVRVTGIKVGG